MAVVTGAAQGIGQAIASGLAEVGSEVVIADLQADRAEAAAAGLRERGLSARAFRLDVTDADGWAALAA
jgi:NAD(P)-dependent dehydrogenase (short-subunit alcohol dehydrogenase family)